MYSCKASLEHLPANGNAIHEPIGLQDANNFLDIAFKENISICDYLKDIDITYNKHNPFKQSNSISLPCNIDQTNHFFLQIPPTALVL